MKANGARIDAAKSLPYFIRDNKAVVDNILNPQPVRAAVDIAKERHAARTAEQERAIRQAWYDRRARMNPGCVVPETLEEMKKRLGDKLPKTLPNLETAIAEYEKTEDYGAIAQIHKTEIETLMRSIFDTHDMGMNIKDSVLDSVLESHFKNTFEVGKSGGYLGSSKTQGIIETSHDRLRAAHYLFGLSDDLTGGQLARADYEKYGSLLDHNIYRSLRRSAAKSYGNVEVRFKKNKVIATWTAGDSLDRYCQPSLVGDPHSCSFDDLYCTPTNAAEDISNFSKFRDRHCNPYLELQYHGKLTADCVESIAFPYDLNDPAHSLFVEVANKWKKTGAKVYYVSGKKMKEL